MHRTAITILFILGFPYFQDKPLRMKFYIRKEWDAKGIFGGGMGEPEHLSFLSPKICLKVFYYRLVLIAKFFKNQTTFIMRMA